MKPFLILNVCLFSLLLCMLSMTITSGAEGSDYFPLTEGVIREYEFNIVGYGTGTYSTYFSGTTDVEGATTHVLHYAGGVDNGLLNLWSETSDGDKLLHGFQIDTYSVHWIPAILAIDEPLYVGKVWEVDSSGYDPDPFAVHIRFEVTAFGDLSVPAGTFEAFTIREVLEWPEHQDAEKGRIRGIRGSTSTTQQTTDLSYADGVGLVLDAGGSRTDRLIALGTVAVQPSTWAGIRSLYR